MLTIFTIPKAFTEESALSQRNAIRSWRRLENVQIILCGDDGGVAEVAAELGCDHYPALRRTDLGTPRLDDAFAAAEKLARHELICYVNADIILDRKSTRLNSSHLVISYAVFCLKTKL